MKKLVGLLCLGAAISGCGGGGGSDDDDQPVPTTAKVSLRITDAPVDDVKKVVITVDKVILQLDGGEDVEIDRFTVPELNLTDVDTFTIDLLDYRNGERLLVVQDLVVPAGTYSQVILQVVDTSTTYSYVQELDDEIKPIKQPSGDLKLGGFTADPSGVYAYTLDFDLRKALTYNPGNNGSGQDRYILKPRGVRLVDEELAASLSGVVDPALFDDAATPCASKTEPLVGNAVYLYQGKGLVTSSLVDIYDPDIATNVPVGAVNPYAAANIHQDTNGTWRYNFGYVPAGDYTLAFSCDAEGDFAETYDGVDIPLPSGQKIELTLTAEQSATCNLPVTGASCAP